MGRGSETQLQVGENLTYLNYSILAGLKLVKLTVSRFNHVKQYIYVCTDN